nr:MAG TPA: hypothetical protein [Caudoviricetes sp.]
MSGFSHLIVHYSTPLIISTLRAVQAATPYTLSDIEQSSFCEAIMRFIHFLV